VTLAENDEFSWPFMIRSIDQQEKHVESFQDSTDAPSAPLTPSTSPTQDAFKIVILRIQYEINGLAIDSSWHAKIDLSLQPSHTEMSRIGLHHGRIFEGSLLKISKDKEHAQSKAKLEGIEILFSGKSLLHSLRTGLISSAPPRVQTRKIFSVQVFLVNRSSSVRQLLIKIPNKRHQGLGETVGSK
jgi:hypothetical protein